VSDLERFVEPIAGLAAKPAPYQVEVFAWYLHEVKQKDRFQTNDIGACFDEVHVQRPANIASVLAKLCVRKPPRVLRDAKGYRLHQDVRKQLQSLLPVRAATVATTVLLNDLVLRVTNPVQKVFLNETLVCFKQHAYRATIVMVWNLAYSHVCDRAFASHLVAFNSQRAKAFAKLPELTKRTDFEDYKESTVIEICRGARIFDASVCKILTERLGRRNSAAHPSSTTFTSVQAEDMITDLANNVLLNPNV
jgi:hypothetical protein